MTLRIKGWERFQHFKDRKPPWIKLYPDLAGDLQWHELAGDDAKTLVMLWLIASEKLGELPSIKELAFRLRVSEKAMKSTVSRLSHWLIQDDIKSISDISTISTEHQYDGAVIPLTRSQELETETEEEGDTSPAKLTTCPVDEIVELYQTILPELPGVRILDKDRVKGIQDRWLWVCDSKKPDGKRRAETPDEAKLWFKAYFERARENDFLMGKTERINGHKGWKCDLDFLMTTKGLKQVIEKTEAVA